MRGRTKGQLWLRRISIMVWLITCGFIALEIVRPPTGLNKLGLNAAILFLGLAAGGLHQASKSEWAD